MTITLDQTRALALLTAGYSSEVQSLSSFKLGWAMTYTPTGSPANNSGYSFGSLQSDLGQRNFLAANLVVSYYQWAGNDSSRRILRSPTELTAAMSQKGKETRDFRGNVIANGLVGNANSSDLSKRPLSADEQAKFNAFLQSSDGRQAVWAADMATAKGWMRPARRTSPSSRWTSMVMA